MVKGVDLSTYQRGVDYQALKDDGVEFAILRIGYGKDSGQMDEMFDEHYRGCKEVGIKVGAYHYSYCKAMANAEKEAQNCLNYLEGYDLDLPVFYDLEDNSILNAGVDVTEIALIFCDKLTNAGYDAGVYSNLNWFRKYVSPYEILNNGYKIWLAQWEVDYPTAEFPFNFWQFTDDLEVGNISCDGNYCEESELDSDTLPTPSDDVIELDVCKALAVDVIYGKYGNGQERKDNLGNYYDTVQDIVNDMYRIIKGE